MKEKIQPVLEFDFQTIKLDEVATLIPTVYRSKYEAIRQQVIEKVKVMPGDESFIFAPAKNSKGPKLDEDLIARICSGINIGLVREQLNWKIAYSDKAKAFVVTPFRRHKMKQPRKNSKVSPEETAARLEKLLEATRKNFNLSLKDLKTKNASREATDVKRAFIYVGSTALGLGMGYLQKVLQITSGTAYPLRQQALINPGSKKNIEILSSALNGGSNS